MNDQEKKLSTLGASKEEKGSQEDHETHENNEAFEDINSKELKEHVASSYNHIDKTKQQLSLQKGKTYLENAANKIGISGEDFIQAQKESNIQEQLQQTEEQANEVADEAKKEIASIAKPEEEKTHEELKNERRREIREELIEEWEAQHGPMEVPLSQKEIEKEKKRAEFWGEKDYRTTRMTEEASEFYFDHKGKGRNDIGEKAEKILKERYPEYQEDSDEETNKNTENSPDTSSVVESDQQEFQETIQDEEQLTKALEKKGLDAKRINIENNKEFPEALIVNNQDEENEKKARIYRGLDHVDASVFDQIPYAMRAESESDKPERLEHMRDNVESIAQNPTYEKLLEYSNEMRKNLSEEEAKRFDEDLEKIEEGILNGNSVRKELMFNQILHGGGRAESGMSPYISASFDPVEASQYGKGGLLIMDVPLSELEDNGTDTETNIKGALDEKNITAVLPRQRESEEDEEQSTQELKTALQRVTEETSTNVYNDNELRSEREKKVAQESAFDKEQWEKDVAAIREKRTKKLVNSFPEVTFSLQNIEQQGIDIYTKAKRDVFDHYKNRLEQIGRNGHHIEDYGYQEEDFGQRKKFNRKKVNDTMLFKLRSLVNRLEEKEKQRNRNK